MDTKTKVPADAASVGEDGKSDRLGSSISVRDNSSCDDGDDAQESTARRLTLRLNGRWRGRFGLAGCPVCQAGVITITAGDRAVRIMCSQRCDRRVIVPVLHARGFLRCD